MNFLTLIYLRQALHISYWTLDFWSRNLWGVGCYHSYCWSGRSLSCGAGRYSIHEWRSCPENQCCSYRLCPEATPVRYRGELSLYSSLHNLYLLHQAVDLLELGSQWLSRGGGILVDQGQTVENVVRDQPVIGDGLDSHISLIVMLVF